LPLVVWEHYRNIGKRHPRLSLAQERRLIVHAKRGSTKSADEIVLSHLNFVIFRLHKRGFRDFVNRYGEDIVSDCIPVLYRQIKTYDLKYRYRDPEGQLKPVKFSSYIWKRVDGFIIDSLKRESLRERREIHVEYEIGG
jgi:hypothetical protein